jgi:hypothetical protein
MRIVPAPNTPIELEVLEGVVLSAHREAVLLGVLRDPVGDRPRGGDAIVLQAQVPVQAGGVVLLDDEAVAVGRRRVPVAGRLGRALRVALALVLRQAVAGGHTHSVPGAPTSQVMDSRRPTDGSSTRR